MSTPPLSPEPEKRLECSLAPALGWAPSSASECVVVDQWPDSAGWWWCRNPKTWMPGDEMCVEIMVPGPYSGFAILWHQEPCPLEDFAGFEWRKAESPFLPNVEVSDAKRSLE